MPRPLEDQNPKRQIEPWATKCRRQGPKPSIDESRPCIYR
jgi:hypothetical protein